MGQIPIALSNRNGTTADGFPYVQVRLNNGVLNAGQTINNVLLKFRNTERVSFTFTCSVRSLVNTPPTDQAPPSVTILIPRNGTVFRNQPIRILGRVDDERAVGFQQELIGDRFHQCPFRQERQSVGKRIDRRRRPNHRFDVP